MELHLVQKIDALINANGIAEAVLRLTAGLERMVVACWCRSREGLCAKRLGRVGGEFVEAIRWVLGELRARNYVAMFGTWRRCASFDCRLEGGLRSLADGV